MQAMGSCTGQDLGERILPYPFVENNLPNANRKVAEWTWHGHREWCEKLWQEGPRKRALKEAKQKKILQVQARWLKELRGDKIPRFEEGRDRGKVAEVYYVHHLPSSKGYVGLAYHGALDRMKTHWAGRNRETDPCSLMMKSSGSPFDWVCWPVERFAGQRQGHKAFRHSTRKLRLRRGFGQHGYRPGGPKG